jgi:membrane protease subunit HflC
LFFQRLRDERGAPSRLDDIIDGETRNVVASHNLIEIVRASNRAFEQSDEVEDVMEAEAMHQVELGRDRITRLILERASQVVPDYGIELVDLQIQRLNYIESVQTKVFERMISERKRIADRFRSEGQGKSAEIRGKKERELKVIESEAYRKTQDIMGRGDAEATTIYADAYDRNPELYKFSKTMETYRHGIDKDSWLVLSTNASLFRYLQSPDAEAQGASPKQ